jgi:hypothetical protein
LSAPDVTPRLSVRRWVLPIAAAVVGVVVLAYALRPYGHEIRTATQEAPIGVLLALTALSLVALVLRTEMWRVAVRASGHDLPRTELHAANSATFTVSLVNGYVGPAAKIYVLRKMRGDREPRVAQLVVTDFAAGLLEVLTAGALVIAAAFAVDLPWWLPVALVVGGLALLGIAFASHRRWEHHPAVQGLNVVIHSYYRYRLLVLLAGVFLSQIVRTWIALQAVDIHSSIGAATLIFVLTGVLGALPTGLAAAPTTASLLVFGHDGVGAAAASGVLVTVSLFAATILYTVVVATIYLLRRRRASSPEAPPPETPATYAPARRATR